MTNVERNLKILQALVDADDLMRPADVGGIIDETALHTGRALAEMVKSDLVRKPDQKTPLYGVTDAGRQYLADPPLSTEAEGPGGSTGGKDVPSVPSQSDLFMAEGQRIGFGSRKGDIKLEAVVNYVQRIANLDDLASVWDAMTEMGVANDVKKRWIKLYAQNVPGKNIPAELKEKLEAGLEGEKIKSDAAGDIPPKPKRFIVVNDQIVGDPEGDLNFKEALQYLAQQKGASPEQASSIALELSKMGPEMMTTILTAFTPLLTKEPPAQDNTLLTALQQRIEQLADAKHNAEMESIRTEIRGAQRAPETDTQIQALGQQLTDLRETLHQEQLANIQQQNKTVAEGLMGEIQKLSDRLAGVSQGKQVESRYGIIEKVVEKGTSELSGIRSDIKGLGEAIIARGNTPRPRTAKEKAGFRGGLEKGIDKSHQATALADELWFGTK